MNISTMEARNLMGRNAWYYDYSASFFNFYELRAKYEVHTFVFSFKTSRPTKDVIMG